MAKSDVLDEFIINYRNIIRLARKNSGIMIYALPGEGKSTMMHKLEEDLPKTWNFYRWGEWPVRKPFIYELSHIDPGSSKFLWPDYDIIYVLHYSREYKEAVTGIRLGDGYRPFKDYTREATYASRTGLELFARTAKNIPELKKIIAGEL